MSTNVTQNSSSGSLIRQAVQRLKSLASGRVEGGLVEKTSYATIDYLGAIASGLQSPWAERVCKYASRRKEISESFCWGSGKDTSAETAAFVNAILAHSAIRDDMHLKSNSHIGSIVISAAMALAQRDSWTGEQLVKAIIGGYEMASLFGSAVQQSESYNRHFRPSGICGAFGAAGAAVTANLVSAQISEDVAVNTLAFAANMAGGCNEWAWAGGLEIYVEMGTASQAGIEAFDLAAAGMECSETVLEGTSGLFRALAASEGPIIFQAGLQKPVGQGLLDVRFKPAPGCNYAQTPLAVALEIATNHNFNPDEIKDITVLCTPGAKNYPGCDNSGPFTNVQQTKMSIQFGVCAALVYGDVSEKTFQKFSDKAISQLVARCTLQAHSGFEESFREGRQPARIEISLSNQNSEKCIAEFPDVPWFTKEAVLKRFFLETSTIIPSHEARQNLTEAIAELQHQPNAKKIFQLFSRATFPWP